jgi:hypothetical protein
VREIADQFMFGPSMMINPVSSQSSRQRSVYLPDGDWYDFWTGDIVHGGRNMTVSAPLDTMPIFVKAGSIIPLGPNIQFATQSIDPLEIRVYRGADAKFDLYEDEGDNYNYELGQYSLIPFSYSEATGQLVIGGRQGTYTDLPKDRTFDIVFVGKNHGSGIGVTPVFDTVVHYDGTQVITGVGIGENNVPFRFALEQNYPNPFNPSTMISYQILASGHVTLKVYDVLGREVGTLVDEVMRPGKYEATLDAGSLSSGVYFYRLRAGSFNATKKLLLLK